MPDPKERLADLFVDFRYKEMIFVASNILRCLQRFFVLAFACSLQDEEIARFLSPNLKVGAL